MSAILEAARRVLRIEAEAVTALNERINGEFVKAVEMIMACSGRVVITGMGKSGLICQKIAATMASTGTPALFLHPAEGVHGDLGMVAKGDVVIAVSNSGETEELTRILPVIKRMGPPSKRRPVRCNWRRPPAPPPPWRWVMPWPWPCFLSAVSARRISPCIIPGEHWENACCCGSRI